MKKALIYFTLMIGITAVIGACKKDEETTTTATSCLGDSTLISVSSCSGTPSGSITGIDNTTLSGVFSTMHGYGHLNMGVDNDTDCIDNSTLITAFTSGMGGAPTGTNSVILNWAVTSSSTISHRFAFYSDTSCATEILSFNWGFKDFTVGDDVTGLTTTVDGKEYSSTASKVSYKQSCLGSKASSEAGVTWLKTFFSENSLNPTVGTTYACKVDGDTKNAFMHVDNASDTSTAYGNGRVVFWDDEATTDWTDNTDTLMVVGE